jgi:hypothetical protein
MDVDALVTGLEVLDEPTENGAWLRSSMGESELPSLRATSHNQCGRE